MEIVAALGRSCRPSAVSYRNMEELMGKKLSAVSIVVAGLLTVSIPVFAHHGNASYDSTKTVTVKGTVTDYIWANPHVFVKVDAKDDAGDTLHWIIEAQSPVSQNDSGWTKNTFKPGDEVILDVIPAKNGQPIGRFRGRIVINGKVFKE
jgi:Family of unknown function (DUF6152)